MVENQETVYIHQTTYFKQQTVHVTNHAVEFLDLDSFLFVFFDIANGHLTHVKNPLDAGAASSGDRGRG